MGVPASPNLVELALVVPTQSPRAYNDPQYTVWGKHRATKNGANPKLMASVASLVS